MKPICVHHGQIHLLRIFWNDMKYTRAHPTQRVKFCILFQTHDFKWKTLYCTLASYNWVVYDKIFSSQCTQVTNHFVVGYSEILSVWMFCMSLYMNVIVVCCCYRVNVFCRESQHLTSQSTKQCKYKVLRDNIKQIITSMDPILWFPTVCFRYRLGDRP